MCKLAPHVTGTGYNTTHVDSECECVHFYVFAQHYSCVKSYSSYFVGALRDLLPVCPSPDQHRLPKWVCPLPGAVAAARSALSRLRCWIYDRSNEVINPHECVHHLSPPLSPLPCEASCWRCFRISPWHHSEWILPRISKSLGWKFHTCQGSKL